MFSRRAILRTGLACAAAWPLATACSAQQVANLSDMARSRGLHFGCAVSRAALEDRDYRQLVLDQCGTLVPENALKWRHMEPNDRSYREDEPQWLSEFASNHGKRMRGHCFLWNHHARMPDWLVAHASVLGRSERRQLTRHMWRHGAYLARHHSSISDWDAMNEAINPSTGELRETHFTRLLGPRFFDLAFRILGERMPDARLVYNETMSWEQPGTHRNGVLRLLERGLSRGLPIHALGIQSHIGKTLGRPRDERAWMQFLEEVQGFGLDVLITEFDCGDRNVASSNTAIRDAEVAAHAKAYLDITLGFTNVRGLTVWALADRHSYMNRPSYPAHRRRNDGRNMRGHPFDADLAPKALLDAMLAAIGSAPRRAVDDAL